MTQTHPKMKYSSGHSPYFSIGQALAGYLRATGWFLIIAGLLAVAVWLFLNRHNLLRMPGEPVLSTQVWQVSGDAREGVLVSRRRQEVGGLASEEAIGQTLTLAAAANFASQGHALLSEDKRVWTAAHVVPTETELYFYNQYVGLLAIKDWYIDVNYDLAAGELTAESVQNLSNFDQISSTTGDSLPAEGTHVLTWSATDNAPTLVHGNIARYGKKISLQEAWGEVRQNQLEVIELTMDNTLGDSGSPVWTGDGRLVGLIVGVDLADEHTTYVVPAAAISEANLVAR